FMVVAGTPDGAYGRAELETPVRSELMAFVTAPRVLGPGEKLTVPVSAFGFLGKNARGTLRLSVSGQATIIGDSSKAVFWPEEGEQNLEFELAIKDETGFVRLTAELSAPGRKTSVQTIEVPVRSAAVPVSVVQSTLINGRNSTRIDIDLPGLQGSNEAWLELSLLPPIDLSSRLSWLIGYPHGCGEQTTSKAFPQLFLADAMALTPEQAEAARLNVSAAITKLAGFQTGRGGFVFWPGGYEESAWLSAYVAHFLVMAGRQGFTVPETMLDPALAYLRTQTMAWASRDDAARAEQSYRLYVLALAGSPDIASMNRFAEYGPLRSAALYQLAAAYALAGMRDRAYDLIKGVTVDVREYEGIWRVYGSELRDKAIVLDAFNALGDSARGLPLFKSIAAELGSGRGYSTQSLSFALIASLPFMKSAASGSATVRYSYAGGEGSVSISKAMARVPLAVTYGTLAVNVSNQGTPAVYARVVASGTPKPGTELQRSEGLILSARYLDAAESPIDPNRSNIGEDMIVEISARNVTGEALNDVALTFRAPSGWEIGNLRVGRSDDADTGSGSSPYDYQDVRDDRVMTYFSLARGETRTYRIFVNKTYAGEYFLPAVTAEAMYRPEVFAVIPGRPLSRVTSPLNVNPRNLRP
ncbi:MAG: hypothetical protein E4H20_04780, partial [Spirochaetales bacterium]